MALADITLVDSQASPVSHVFSYVGTENGQVIRKNLTAAPDVPETLVIGHRKVKVAGVQVDSHLWKLTLTYLDADGITPRQMSARVIWDIDNQIYTDARVEDMAAMTLSALTEAFVKAVTKGSVG